MSNPEPAIAPTAPRVPELGADRAIRGGAVRVVGYATGVLVSLGAAAILVRHLGIEGFGRYVTVTSLIALVGGVTEAGIVVYGIREFATDDEGARGALVGNLLAMRVAFAAIGIVIAVAFGLVASYPGVLVIGTLVAGAGLIAQVVADVLSIPLQAHLLLGRLTLIEVGRRLIALALIAALALLDASLLPFLAATSLAALGAAVLMARATRSFAIARPSFDRRVWRRLFADTLPYAVALSVAAIYLYVTVILMSVIANATETGLFATSFRITQAGLAVPALLLTAIFPLMARGGGTLAGAGASAPAGAPEGFGATVGKVFVVAVVFGTWMTIATILGASFIVELIAGSSGQGAVPVLRIQAIVFVASFVSTSSALGLVALRRYRELLWTSGGTLALNIALGLALVPSLGAEGGAIADVAAEAVAAIAMTALLMRAVPDHGIRAAFLPALALAVGVSAIVLALPIGSFGQAAVASVLFFAVVLRTHILPREVGDAARRMPLPRVRA